LLGVLTLSAGRTSAWNSHGHMAVAKIAYDQLTDGEKMKIAKILKDHPHFTKFLTVGKPGSVSEAEWAFLKAATWPDWVRPGRKKPKEITKYHSAPAHFVDKPFIHPDDREEFKEKDLQPKEETVLTALPMRVKELSAEEAADQAVALCWVLHLIGDVHQPLHCA